MRTTNCLAVALSILVGYGVLVPLPLLAASWGASGCAGVSPSERGLWFDSPGAGGVNNESGLVWLVTDESINESCTYQTVTGGPANLSTTEFPTLRVRLAVNDGATVRVDVFGPAFEFCDELVGSVSTTATEDNSVFRTKEVTLPAGRHICAVGITLDDDPNDSPGADRGRASALIDYIHLRNGASIGWAETFSGGNP